MDMRCRNKLHGRIIQPAAGGVVEFKCGSVYCGAQPGAVVLHRFSTLDGKLVKTLMYKDTPTIAPVQGEHNGLGHSPSVRSA